MTRPTPDPTRVRRAGPADVPALAALQLGRANAAGREFYGRQGYAPRERFELLDKPLRRR